MTSKKDAETVWRERAHRWRGMLAGVPVGSPAFDAATEMDKLLGAADEVDRLTEALQVIAMGGWNDPIEPVAIARHALGIRE